MEKLKNYVDGEWNEGRSDGTILVNPATEAELAQASTDGVSMHDALAFARRVGSPALRELTFEARAEMIGKVSSTLLKHREMLLETSVANCGSTRGDAKFDVDGAIGTLTAYAELGRSLGRSKKVSDGEGVALGRSPRFWGQHVWSSRRGVAVLINAFNFPAWGFAEKAACAWLAGMPVFVKPATATALTTHRMIEVLVDADVLPKGALSFIAGSPNDLLDHLDWHDVVSFTGSAATGRKLRESRAIVEKNIPLNVEADSINAAILGPDVERDSDLLRFFAREIAKDLTQKTGQKCTAVRRIFVPDAMVADVVAQLSARFAEIKVGDPSHNEVGMGPLSTRAQLEEVTRGVERLAPEAEIVFGQRGAPQHLVGATEGRGYFHSVVLLKARSSADATRIHSEEVFGPVATIVSYSGKADEVATLVSAGKGGLVASVYSDDRSFIEATVDELLPWHGRVYIGGTKVVDHTLGPGAVLPLSLHGGPGRAGGGEELGGLRGVFRFMHRTALQGYKPIVEGLASPMTPTS